MKIEFGLQCYCKAIYLVVNFFTFHQTVDQVGKLEALFLAMILLLFFCFLVFCF